MPVRAARRIAERRDAPWSVVTVQVSDTVDEVRQREIDQGWMLPCCSKPLSDVALDR